MFRKRADPTDYQVRAREFHIGDLVYPFLPGKKDLMGRVVAVYPGIGMVDVQWPHGSERKPVEELGIYESESYKAPAISTVLGEKGDIPIKQASIRRVVRAYMKEAVYWAAADRKYRAAQTEIESGQYKCPKCRVGLLMKTAYKRRGGKSEKLLGCPNCMFLIKEQDVIGHPNYEDYIEPEELQSDFIATIRKGDM